MLQLVMKVIETYFMFWVGFQSKWNFRENAESFLCIVEVL